MSASITNVPVLIVGAGPAGLATAIGLARHGVRSMLVERHPGTSIFPKASGISTRTMEIVRSWGLEAAAREHSLEMQPFMSVRPTLTAPQLGMAPLGFPTAEQAAAVSPTRPALIPQDRLEPVLLEHAIELGVDVRFSTELVSLEQDGDGATATIRPVDGGPSTTVRADYVVGADGTRSTVRGLLGIEAHGPTDLGDYVTILFRAELYSKLNEPPFGLYQLAGPVPGVLVPTGPDDRWVLGLPWNPKEESFEDYSPERCIALIRAATGVPDLDIELIATMPIEFVAQAADRTRDGRTFLIGDAAHRMPPFGGRGLNTAVADAFGLSWKLAWVLRGWADAALLDTHVQERDPVGRFNLSLARERSEGGTPDGLTEDLGYVYRSMAIHASDVAGEPAPSHLFPTVATPGARMPHAWLEGPDGRISTLDLVGPGLTLLTGPGGNAWLDGASAIAPNVPFVVDAYLVGELDSRDGVFCERFGLGSDGAVLVRPDGHIAWRAEAGSVTDYVVALGDAVARATGRATGTARGPEVAMAA
ncbi:MAG TPA: FAD-dependent monooxygenase [Candidatus Limnocylindrales bacterium]|nr:FAD-dependent monooxygenase [Candidatus Limnocylindrales bacterium]